MAIQENLTWQAIPHHHCMGTLNLLVCLECTAICRAITHMTDLRSESNADSDIMWPSSSVGGTANFNDIIFPTDHHHRMSTVALYCGQRIDAMSLAWQDMEATGSAKPAPLLRRHGGSSGTLKQPILALDAGRYIYKVVAHNAYHDKHQPLRLGYLELHVATWNTAPDGSRSMGKYWNPVTCGTPSKFPGKVPNSVLISQCRCSQEQKINIPL